MFKKIAKIAVAVAALFGGLATPVAQADPIADIMRTLPAGSSFAAPVLPTLPGAVPADVQIIPGQNPNNRIYWLCPSGSCRKYLSAPELDNMAKKAPSNSYYPSLRMAQGFVVTDYYLVRNDVAEDLKYIVPQFNNNQPIPVQVCPDNPSAFRLVKYDMRKGTETATAFDQYCA